MAKGNRGGKRAGVSSKSNVNKPYKELDKELIRHANNTSFMYEAGDAINRQYQKHINTIQELELTDIEKTEAYSKLHELTTNLLSAQSKSVSPYVSGRGGINPNQVRKNADTVSRRSAEVTDYVNSLIRKSTTNIKKQKEQRFFDGLKKADEKGLLEVTIDGETWRRSRKNSKTWTKKT